MTQITVSINNLNLCHETNNGISMATVPDVCKTPSPGGPVPVPYPNVAVSCDLANGTTTVSADGGSMCAVYGSEFSRSTGDEAGTVGGVASGTFMREATWITFSFDVKLEGKGACRHTDKMFHNHQNAVNMGGLVLGQQAGAGPGGPEDPCVTLAREIDELVNRDKRQFGNGGRHGLKHRFREQINGANGPPGSGVGDPAVWDEHDKVIKQQQGGLRDRLNDYNKNNCGDKVPIPQDAWQWATRPAPKPQEWIRPAESASFSQSFFDSDFMRTMSELTGLTGITLLMYVIVSESSRVLFPPRNAFPLP